MPPLFLSPFCMSKKIIALLSLSLLAACSSQADVVTEESVDVETTEAEVVAEPMPVDEGTVEMEVEADAEVTE